MRYADNMDEFRGKRKIRRFFYSRAMIVILLVLFFLALDATWGVFVKYRETQANKKEAASLLSKLKGREKDIKEEIAELETDRGIEREIRKQFGFVKDGEGVIVFVEPQEPDDVGLRANAGIFGGIWGGIKSIFGGD